MATHRSSTRAAAADGRYAQAMEPLLQSLVAAFFLLFLVTGIAYGRAAGVNRSHRDEIRMISEGMASMAYYVVMAFVAAHFVAMFNWSNLGTSSRSTAPRRWADSPCPRRRWSAASS